MSLKGSLSQLGLADLLQGALVGRQGNFHLERAGSRAILHVDAHDLRIVAPDSLPAGALLQGLVHRGVLDGATYREAARKMGAVESLDHLVEAGYVPAPEVERLLREASEDAILDLLTWQKGEFRFEEGEAVPADAGLISRVSADRDGVLLRAAQRLDERTAIAQGLGSEAHLYLPLSKTPPKLGFEGDPVAQVHALVDGVRVVDEIVALSGLTHFVTLRAILACVDAAAVRPATASELWHGAERRTAHGETRVARLLLQQWASLEPERRTAMAPGAAEQALRVLRGRLTRHPEDAKALFAVLAIAEAVGDEDLRLRTVMSLARQTLAEDDPARAAELLAGLPSGPDTPLELRELRGHVFLALEDEEGLAAEAEAIRDLVGRRCHGSRELALAGFFRDALAEVAPERRDLIQQLRTARRLASPIRRFGPIAALLLLVAVAGVLLWPESPASILAKAQDAVARGRDQEALEHIADLAERFPDASETRKAAALESRLYAVTPKRPTPCAQLGLDDERVQSALEAIEDALPRLPAPVACADVDASSDVLHSPDASAVRRIVVDRLTYGIGRAAERMGLEVGARADAFAKAAELADSPEPDERALRELVTRTTRWAEDDYANEATAAAAALERLLDGSKTPALRRAFRKLEQELERLRRDGESHALAVDACRRAVAQLDLRAAHERCVGEGSEHLAAGRLDEAGACYGVLGDLIETIAADPVLQPLEDEAGVPDMKRLLDLRRSTLTEIRRSLDSAAAAEQAGDIEAAIEAYSSLTQRFGSIGFENVIQVPLEVRTVPPGAAVCVNDEPAGTSPVVIHYPWNTRATLTAERPGYEAVTHTIEPSRQTPEASLDLALPPEAVWSVEVEAAVSSAPVPADRDLLVCDRTGRVHLHKGEDGHAAWSRRIEGVEDIRARPAVNGGLAYLPMIDGQVLILDLYDGRESGTLRLSGNLYASAVLGDLVAIVNLRGELTGVRGRRTAFTVSLGSSPASDILTAHGCLWIGTDDGCAVRVDAKGEGVRYELPGRRGAVQGLASHADGVLAAKADGTLHSLTPDGTILWSADAVGDVVGRPAAAAGKAACIDARGRVVLFDLATGTPRGQIDLGLAPRAGGFLEVSGLLVAHLRDGRIWIHDPTTGTERAFFDLGADATAFGVTPHGDDHLVASAAGDTIRLLRIPGR